MRKLFYNFVVFSWCNYFADMCKTRKFWKILIIFTNKENKQVVWCLQKGVFLHYVTYDFLHYVNYDHLARMQLSYTDIDED